MKALIIDDEKPARETLRILLNESRYSLEIIGEAGTVQDSIDLINKADFNVLFLDIELLDGSGFDILESINKSNFCLIFTTAFNKYAVEAFRKNAIDYLLKPIDLDDLNDAIERCVKKENKSLNQIEILNKLRSELNGQKIVISSSNRLDMVNTNDIIYIRSEGSYSNVFIENNKSLMSSKPLKIFEKSIGKKQFFRVNKSIVINLNKISHYRKDIGYGQIVMISGEEFELSRRRKPEFHLLMNQYRL